MPEIVPPPPAPVTRALLRLLAAAIAVLASLFVVLSVAYFGLNSRADRQARSIAALAAANERQAQALASVERLAAAFARLTSADPAERQAAREELARMAAEAQRSANSSTTTTRSPTGDSLGPPPTTTPPPAPTTTRPVTGTTTTRPCVARVLGVEVCR